MFAFVNSTNCEIYVPTNFFFWSMKNESKDKIPIISSEQFMNYFLDNNYDENMFDSNGHINHDYNSSKKNNMYI